MGFVSGVALMTQSWESVPAQARGTVGLVDVCISGLRTGILDVTVIRAGGRLKSRWKIIDWMILDQRRRLNNSSFCGLWRSADNSRHDDQLCQHRKQKVELMIKPIKLLVQISNLNFKNFDPIVNRWLFLVVHFEITEKRFAFRWDVDSRRKKIRI